MKITYLFVFDSVIRYQRRCTSMFRS